MAGFNLTAQLNLRGPNNVKQIVSDIQKQLGTITGNVNLKISATATRDVTSLNAALRQLNTNLAQTQTNASGAANAISAFANAARSVNRNVNATSTQINATTNSTNKLAQSQKTVAKALSQSSTTMQEFGKQSALAVRRFAAYSAATGTILGLANAIRSGLTAFIAYEKQFVKVQQVTNKTAAQLSGLNSEINRLSTSLGVASSDLISVSSTLAQAGLSAAETQKALQALALTDLSPSFDSLNDTVEGSIALMRQFNIGARELEKSLGSVNAVSAAFAVESADLIAAIQRTGGVFAAASRGVSEGTNALNEFLAVFTSVRQTTRESAETIATGLRTIFTRIQREDTIQALREYGVNLTDVEGKFVGAYKAVELLSRGLSTLDPRDIRFSNIVEELGGFRQIGKVIPLIQQFSVAQEALFVAQKGQGSLAKDAIVAQQSLANQLSKVREEFLALMRSIGSSDTFQTIAKNALGFTSVLIKVADTIKGVLPVLAILGARKIASGIGQYATGFVGGLLKSTNNNANGGGQSGPGSQPIRPTFPVVGGGSGGGSSTRNLSLLDDIMKQNVQAINSLSGNFNSLQTNINNLGANISTLNNSLNTITSSLAAINQYSQALQNNTNSLNSLSGSISSLNTIIGSLLRFNEDLTRAVYNLRNTLIDIDNKGSSSSTGLNSGGKVHRFARGGVVPGTGNTDSVPAMLQPGEFVIRKKAVETIGAENLHSMNKYGSGGSVTPGPSGKRRQKFAGGGKVFVDYPDEDISTKIIDSSLATAINSVSKQLSPDSRNIKSSTAKTMPNYAGVIGSIFEAGLARASNEKYIDDTKSFDFPDGITNVKTYSKLRGITSDAKRNFDKNKNYYKNNILNKIGNTLKDNINTSNKDFGVAVMSKGLDTSFDWTPESVFKAQQKITLTKFNGGIIQKFLDGGWVERMQQQKKSSLVNAATQIEYWIDKIYAGTEEVGFSPSFKGGKNPSEKVDFKELQERLAAIDEFLNAPVSSAKAKKSGLKATGGYEPEEMLDAVKLYQGGSGPLTRAMANNDLLFVDRDEQYDTEDVVNRLQSAAQYKTRKKLYSGLGRSQFYETLKDTGLSEDDISDQNKVKSIVGKTIDFPTFLSTSYKKEVAEGFVGDPGAMMTISTAKSKTSGIDVNKAKMTSDSGKPTARRLPGIDKIPKEKLFKYDDEDEFILPPNTAFKVKQASSNKIRAKSEDDEEWDIIMGTGGDKTPLMDIAVQMLMAGGRAKAKPVKKQFGTGAFPFPKRISNAYFREIDKALEQEKIKLAWDTYPIDERILVDESSVLSTLDSPFDKSAFTKSFSEQIRRDALFGQIGQFAKFIGLPSEDLSAVLPRQIDFGIGLSAQGAYHSDPTKADKGLGRLDLGPYGFSEQDKQDLYGYEALAIEKEKETAKVLKTPVKTFDDGSFSYDSDKAQALWQERRDLASKISTLMGKRLDAQKLASQAISDEADRTGRGSVTINRTSRNRPNQGSILYHELTHQLFQGLKTKKADSFDKYKQRVNSLFENDNNGLVDAFDALGGGYNSADIVYGRAYKIRYLQLILRNLLQDKKLPGKDELATSASLAINKGTAYKKAQEFKPINPEVNDLLLQGNLSQQSIDKMEDNGKEEFLTTLVEKSPMLDANLQTVLDSTLSSLLADAGIQRQAYASGGLVQKFAIGGEAQSIADKLGFGKPLADSWWTGNFAGQDILFDWASPTRAYKISDGSKIDIDQNLRKPLRERAQREWLAFVDQRTKERDAAKKPLSEEEQAKLAEATQMLTTSAQQMAEKKKKQQAEDYIRRTEKFSGDYEPSSVGSSTFRRGKTPQERRDYYLKRARGYMAGGVAEEPAISPDLQQLLDRISAVGGPKTATELAGYPSGSMNIRKLLNKNSLLAGKNIPQAEAIVAKAEEAYKKKQAASQSAIDAANEFALVGAYPVGYSKDYGPEEIGGRSTFFTARGLPSKYQQEIDEIAADVRDLPSRAAEKIQMRNIFGTGTKLAFDLDDTLITDADIFKPGSSADPDIPAYSDVARVTEALKNAKLTRLGEVLKSKLTDTPQLLEDIRILTARPQNNAQAISARLTQLGLAISADKITGVSGATNKVHNLSELETLIDDRLATIEQVNKAGKKAIAYEPIRGYDPTSPSAKKATQVIEGYVIEGLMERLGVPIVEDDANRAIDYPNGLGSKASIWGVKPNVPTDVKRTMDGDAFGRFRNEIARYYEENTVGMMFGGKVKSQLLDKYKGVLSRVLPEDMLSEEGLFRGTTKKDISVSQNRNFGDWVRYLLGVKGASYSSDYRSYVSQALLAIKDQIDPNEFTDLETQLSHAMEQKKKSSRIFIPKGSKDTDSLLAHESVHDIQHKLRTYYPDIYTKLTQSAIAKKSQVAELLDKNKVGYSSEAIFGTNESKLAYRGMGSSIMQEMLGIRTAEELSPAQKVLGNKIEEYKRNDEILAILMQLSSRGVSDADNILSDILESSGLKSKRYAVGGSVEDTVPALLTPGEFVINKKAAQSIGYAKLEKLNQADKIQGFNKGGFVQHFVSGGKAAPGDYEAGVQKVRMQLEALGKAAAKTTYTLERSRGTSAIDAKTAANSAENIAIQQEAIRLLKTATGDAAQQIHDAIRTLEEDRRKATSGSYTPPSGSGLDPAARKAADALEYFSLQARYYGTSVQKYTNDLKNSIVSQTVKLSQDIPQNINRFRTRVSQLRSTLQLPDNGDNQERITDARDEISDLIKNITGEFDNAKISAVVQELEYNLDQTGLSFGEAINSSKLLSDLFDQATSRGGQYARVLQEFSDATGLAVEELEKIASLEDVTAAEENQKLINSTNKLSGYLAQASVYLSTLGGVVSKLVDAPNDRKARITSAGIGGATQTAGSLLAFGSNILSTTSATAAMTGGGSLAAAASSLMPILTDPITLAAGGVVVALGGLAAGLKDASNAAKEFDIQKSSENVDKSLQRVSDYFTDFAQDLKNLNLLSLIERELDIASSNALASIKLQSEVPTVFWTNLIDALATGDAASAERSRILEQRGIGSYLDASTFGQDVVSAYGMIVNGALLGIPDLLYAATSSAITGRNFSETSIFTDLGYTDMANRSRNTYTQLDAPRIAVERSKQLQPVAESIFRLFEERVRSGTDVADVFDQLGTSDAPTQFADTIARANPVVEEQIIRIKASNVLNKAEQEARINSIIAMEAEYKTRLRVDGVLKQLEFERLSKETKQFTTSIQRMLNGMDAAINRTISEIEQLGSSADLSNQALSGSAQAGQVFIKGINILQNTRAYSSEDRRSAFTQASRMFGPMADIMSSLLGISDKMEDVVLSTINETIRTSSEQASPEKISGAIRSALNTALLDLNLPPDLADKLSKQTQRAFSELRSGDNKKLSFSELVEKVPQFAETIDAAKSAQQEAIKALEFWQSRVNDYAKMMNQSLEYQLEANNTLRNVLSIRIKSENDLARTLGRTTNLINQRSDIFSETGALTGGITDPTAIRNRIFELETVRATQQGLLNQEAQGGPENQEAVQRMTRNLNLTNLALRENYQALKNMAESSDLASNALAKINELQQKNQAGQNLIEKAVTSNFSEMMRFNRSLSLLSRNMAGQINPGSTPEKRSEVLQAFSLIAPLLGEKQNALKANVFESLLLESGVGISGLFRDVITSLRNPEADPTMSEAIGIYKQGVKLQIDANRSLAEIQKNMSNNTAEAAGKSLALALNVPDNLQVQLLQDIKQEIQNLVKLAAGNPVQNKASGGVVYADSGMFVNFQSKGTDTVPAMLTPGEFVVNRTATAKNLPLLKSINSGNTSYYARGGLVVEGAWASPSYAGNEIELRKQALEETHSETADKFLALKTLANPPIDTDTVHKAPNKYYAVGKESKLGEPITSSFDNFTLQQSLNKDKIIAAPGIAYDQFTFDMGLPYWEYATTMSPQYAARSGLRDFTYFGKMPKIASIRDIVDYVVQPKKAIKQAERINYIKSYEYLQQKLKDSVSMYEKTNNLPDEESIANQLNRATQNIRSRISVTGKNGWIFDPVTVGNLTYDPGGENNSLLFLNTPVPGQDVGNILGVKWNMNTSAQIIGGAEGMRGSLASKFNDNALSYQSYQNGMILSALKDFNTLDSIIQQNLDGITNRNLEYVEEETSATRKGFIGKLDSLYDKKVFSVNLGSEIFRNRNGMWDLGIKLPLTLYNMDRAAFDNYIANINVKKRFRENIDYAKDDWIKITDIDTDNNIVGSREFPWTSKDFAEEDRNIQERFGKDFGIKPIKVSSKTYGQVGKGKFYISYKEIFGKIFNEKTGQFDGPDLSYLMIDPATQDQTFNPGSPLAEIIPNTKKLVWGSSIERLVNYLSERTPDYDFENGVMKPEKVPPRYEYPFNFSDAGGFSSHSARVKNLLQNNAEYASYPDLRDYIVSAPNTNKRKWNLDSFRLISTAYKKATEDKFEKSKVDNVNRSKDFVTDSDLFDLKTSLTEEDKVKGLGVQDIESFNAAKRVTLARYFYQQYAGLAKLRTRPPASIQDIQAIVNELGLLLPKLSIEEGGIGGEKYNDIYALRNIFGTFVKPKDSDAGYLKRLGFSLKNKDFVNRVPPAIDPANPERTQIQYYDKYNIPDVNNLINLLFNRERDYVRAAGNTTSPNRTPFTDELRERIQNDVNGFSLSQIDTRTGRITDAKEKQKIQQWTDVEKVALNPYNIPSESSIRQKLLDDLYYFYSTDKDAKNKNIWPKERSEFIGTKNLFGNRKVLESDEIAGSKPSTLKEWYSIQDNILNNQKTPEDKKSQAEELDDLGPVRFKALISADLQNKHKYLTGNLYGSLPDYKYIVSKLSSKPEEPDVAGMSNGGVVYASTGKYIDFSPRGTDTVPAMLTPGEFVVNRTATQKHLPLLQSINKSNGGSISKINNGTIYASGGALIDALPYAANAINEAWIGFGDNGSPVNFKKSITYLLKSISTAAGAPETEAIIKTFLTSIGLADKIDDVMTGTHSFGQIDLGILSKIFSSGAFVISGLEKIVKAQHYGEHGEDGKMFGAYGQSFSYFLKAINEYKSSDFVKKIFGKDATKPIYALSALINAANSLNYSPEETGVSQASGAAYAAIFDNPKAETDFSSALQETIKGAYNIHKLTGAPYPVAAIASAVLQNIKQVEALSYQVQDFNQTSLDQRLRNMQGAAIIGERSEDYISLDEPLNKIGISEAKMSGLLGFYDNLGSLIFNRYTKDLSIREIGEQAIQARKTLPIPYGDDDERFDLIDKKIKPSDKINSPVHYALMNKYYKQGFDNIWPTLLEMNGRTGKQYTDLDFGKSNKQKYKNLPNNYNFAQKVSIPTTMDIDSYIDLYQKIKEHNEYIAKNKARDYTGKDSELFNFLGSEDIDSSLIEIASKIEDNYIQTKQATAMYAAQGAGSVGLGLGKMLSEYESDFNKELSFRKRQQTDTKKMFDGGVVYASTGKYINFEPKGTDTIPAMLTPGEFVVNKAATQQNLPLLKAMNQGGVIYRQRGSQRPEQLSTMPVYTDSYSGSMIVRGGSTNISSPNYDPSARMTQQPIVNKSFVDDLTLKIKMLDEVLRLTEQSAETRTVIKYPGAGGVGTEKVYTTQQQESIATIIKEKDKFQKLLTFHLLGTDGPGWDTRIELLLKQASELGVGMTGGAVGGVMMAPTAPATLGAGPAAGAAAGYLGSVYTYREIMGKKYRDRLDLLRQAYPNQSFVTDLAPLLLIAGQAKTIIGGIKEAAKVGGVKAVATTAAGDLTGDVLANTLFSFSTGQPYTPMATDAIFSLLGVKPNSRQKTAIESLTSRKDSKIVLDNLQHSHITTRNSVSRIDSIDEMRNLLRYAGIRKSLILDLFGDIETARNSGVSNYEDLVRYAFDNQSRIKTLTSLSAQGPAGILLPKSINNMLKNAGAGIDLQTFNTILDALGPILFSRNSQYSKSNQSNRVKLKDIEPYAFIDKLQDRLKIETASTNGIVKDEQLARAFESLSSFWTGSDQKIDLMYDRNLDARMPYSELTDAQKRLLDSDIGTPPGSSGTYGSRSSEYQKRSPSSANTGSQGRLSIKRNADGTWPKKPPRNANNESPVKAGIFDRILSVFKPREIPDGLRFDRATLLKELIDLKDDALSPERIHKLFRQKITSTTTPRDIAKNIQTFAAIHDMDPEILLGSDFHLIIKDMKDMPSVGGFWQERGQQMYVRENMPGEVLVHELLHNAVQRYGGAVYDNFQNVLDANIAKIIAHMESKPNLFRGYDTRTIANGLFYQLSYLSGSTTGGLSRALIDNPQLIDSIIGNNFTSLFDSTYLSSVVDSRNRKMSLPMNLESVDGKISIPIWYTNLVSDAIGPPPPPVELNADGQLWAKGLKDTIDLSSSHRQGNVDLDAVRQNFIKQMIQMNPSYKPDELTKMFNDSLRSGREEYITQLGQNLLEADWTDISMYADMIGLGFGKVLESGVQQPNQGIYLRDHIIQLVNKYRGELGRRLNEADPEHAKKYEDRTKPVTPPLPGSPKPFNNGGVVYASTGKLIDFQPRGTDTVPAMLTPGEFVVNRAATQKHLPLLKAINSGSNSKAYSKGGVVYLADGGDITEEMVKEQLDLNKSIVLRGETISPNVAQLLANVKHNVELFLNKMSFETVDMIKTWTMDNLGVEMPVMPEKIALALAEYPGIGSMELGNFFNGLSDDTIVELSKLNKNIGIQSDSIRVNTNEAYGVTELLGVYLGDYLPQQRRIKLIERIIKEGGKIDSQSLGKEDVTPTVAEYLTTSTDPEVYLQYVTAEIAKNLVTAAQGKGKLTIYGLWDYVEPDAMLELLKHNGDLDISDVEMDSDDIDKVLLKLSLFPHNLELDSKIQKALEEYKLGPMTLDDITEYEYLSRNDVRKTWTPGQEKRYQNLRDKMEHNDPELKDIRERKELEMMQKSLRGLRDRGKEFSDPKRQERYEYLLEQKEKRRMANPEARAAKELRDKQTEYSRLKKDKDRSPEDEKRLQELRMETINPEERKRQDRLAGQRAAKEEYDKLWKMGIRSWTPEDEKRVYELMPLLFTPEQVEKIKGNIAKTKAEMRVRGLSTGGVVYASDGQLINFQPRGTDTVPAMLTPGEFVVNRSATQKHLPLLKAINNGLSSHQDIVNKFNNGGYVKPNYYQQGAYVTSSPSSQNNSFDFAGFMQKLMGQLSGVIGSAIKEGMSGSNNAQNIDNRSNGVSINIESQVLDRINDFTNRLRSVADTLAGLSAIPSDIRITAKHDINIVINGDSVLNRLNPEIQNIVMQELRKGFQNLVDNNSPVPSDKLINPFDIRPT